MATNQVVQVQVDDAIMAEATASLAKMGLTVSDAVQLMLTRVAHEHTLPFEPLIPNTQPTMFATIEEALSWGEGFRKRLDAVMENPESRPPWVSSISSLYASTDASSVVLHSVCCLSGCWRE